jgi:hypothetical protein
MKDEVKKFMDKHFKMIGEEFRIDLFYDDKPLLSKIERFNYSSGWSYIKDNENVQ